MRPYFAIRLADDTSSQHSTRGGVGSGHVIEARLFIEDLPCGFPTEPFHPELIGRRYAVVCELRVMDMALLLTPAEWTGAESPPTATISYAAFLPSGLPITIEMCDESGTVTAVSGRLCPLLTPPPFLSIFPVHVPVVVPLELFWEEDCRAEEADGAQTEGDDF